MAKSKKRKRLEDGGVLDPKARLSKEQSDALESLSTEEVEAVISARKKLKNVFPSTPIIPGPGMKTGGHNPTAD